MIPTRGCRSSRPDRSSRWAKTRRISAQPASTFLPKLFPCFNLHILYRFNFPGLTTNQRDVAAEAVRTLEVPATNMPSTAYAGEGKYDVPVKAYATFEASSRPKLRQSIPTAGLEYLWKRLLEQLEKNGWPNNSATDDKVKQSPPHYDRGTGILSYTTEVLSSFTSFVYLLKK